MFFSDSTTRRTLRGWLGDLFRDLRAENSDAIALDQITATEILDLAYLQGSSFDTASAAHALYPEYVEQSERLPVPSAMSATFPVRVEELKSALAIEVRIRGGVLQN